MRRVPAEILLLGGVLLWSFNFTAVRFGVTHGFSPLAYAPLRWGMAGLALAAIARRRGRSLRVGSRDLGILVALSVAGILVNQITLVYALHLAQASTVALVFGTLPILISLISQVSGVERLRPRHWAASGVSFAGVGLVTLGAGGALTGSLGGMLLALVTVVSFAVYSVAIVPVMGRHTPLVATAVTTSSSGPCSCLLQPRRPSPARTGPGRERSRGGHLYSALPSIVLGNILWFTAISRVGPGRASLSTNLQPFLAAVFGAARAVRAARGAPDRRRLRYRGRAPP